MSRDSKVRGQTQRLLSVRDVGLFTPFAVHLEKRGNHLHSKSDNNAKIRSIAPIGIQMRQVQKSDRINSDWPVRVGSTRINSDQLGSTRIDSDHEKKT